MKQTSLKKKQRVVCFLASTMLLLAVCLSLTLSGADALSTQDYSVSKFQCVWRNVDKIVVVGDLHGAYENFVKILKATGLVDDLLQWTGGKAHLVQMGDILDRGDRARDIFDLLMRLEEEAELSGGYVHVLIGNHEEMNLADTAFDNDEYITPQQFVSFLSKNYIKKQEKIFRRKAGLKSMEDLPPDLALTQHWQEVIESGKNKPSHVGRRSYFRNLNNQYGRWILSHNLAVKINDVIFVHAGIAEPYSTMNLESINRIYRMELDAVRTGILTGHMPSIPVYEMRFYNNPSGPLWTRDFVRNSPEDFVDDLERLLFNLGANQMIIGHSPVAALGKEGMRLYDGKIWVADTGISEYYLRRGGFIGALLYERGKISVWTDQFQSPAGRDRN